MPKLNLLMERLRPELIKLLNVVYNKTKKGWYSFSIPQANNMRKQQDIRVPIGSSWHRLENKTQQCGRMKMRSTFKSWELYNTSPSKCFLTQ